MITYSTEYLILNEDSINWDSLSSKSDDMFSLVEIRLFRSKINWKLYFESHSHSCPFTTEMLEVGSKYFTKNIYKLLSNFNILTEDFFINHVDKFEIEDVILNCNVSEECLLQVLHKWKNIPNVKEIFRKSKYINIESPEYSQIKLILEIE